jgi:hypothetical protein
MKTTAFFVLCGLCILGSVMSPTEAAAAEKLAIEVNDTYTFFALPFTLSSNKSQIVVPTTAKRDLATSTSIGFTLKTPEGLRQTAGQAVGLVTTGDTSGEYILYVLYKDTTPSARINTVAITHLPFLLVNDKTGTSSQKLNQSELRQFVVKNENIKRLSDTE